MLRFVVALDRVPKDRGDAGDRPSRSPPRRASSDATVLWSEEIHHRPVAPASKLGALAPDGEWRTAEEFTVFCGVGARGVSRR